MIGSELLGRREALGAFLSSFLLVALAREARAAVPPGAGRVRRWIDGAAGDRRGAGRRPPLRPAMGVGGRAAGRRDRDRGADGGGRAVAAALGGRSLPQRSAQSASSASSTRPARRAASLTAPPCSISRRTMSSRRTATATWSRPISSSPAASGCAISTGSATRTGAMRLAADARLCRRKPGGSRRCAASATTSTGSCRRAGRPRPSTWSYPASTPAGPITHPGRRSARARAAPEDGSLIAPIIGFAESSRLYTAAI